MLATFSYDSPIVIDGITNPKYKLFRFLTTIIFLQTEEETSFLPG
jgi:hypothetical protein